MVTLVVWRADGGQELVVLAESESEYGEEWLPLAQREALPQLIGIAAGHVVEFTELEGLSAELERLAAAASGRVRERAEQVRSRITEALQSDVIDAFVG